MIAGVQDERLKVLVQGRLPRHHHTRYLYCDEKISLEEPGHRTARFSSGSALNRRPLVPVTQHAPRVPAIVHTMEHYTKNEEIPPEKLEHFNAVITWESIRCHSLLK